MKFIEKFDVVYSIGSACSCANALNRAELRTLAGPFDWIINNTNLETTLNILRSGGEHFLEEEDLCPSELKPEDGHDVYFNKRTGVHFVHDFPTGCSVNEALAEVQAKYERRFRRMYQFMQRKKVLLVRVYRGPCAEGEEEVVRLCEAFSREMKGEVSFLVILHEEGKSGFDLKKAGKRLWLCKCDTMRQEGADVAEHREWQGNVEMLVQILSHFRVRRHWWRSKKVYRVLTALVPLGRWRRELRKKLVDQAIG